MNRETIESTIKTWTAEPEKAKGKPAVKALSAGATAAIEAGPFKWQADLPPPLGGTNQAPSPTALLLSALAGCAVVFVRDTLGPQLGVRIEHVDAVARCDADARGLLGLAGAVPDLTNVQLDVQIKSPDGEPGVRKVMDAWKARCPIYLALTKPVSVTLNISVSG